MLGLRRLTAIASVKPIPDDSLDQPTRDLAKRLDEAGPYLLALYEGEAPSELALARGRLGRLTVSVVQHLILRVSVRDVMPEELLVEENAYLKQTRLLGTGPIRPAAATYYCTPTAAGDFYRLGSGVADFLERPTLGDAFSIVLRAGRDERMRFLAAKGIDAARLGVMRELLGRPEEEVEDEVIVPAPRTGTESDGRATTAGQNQHYSGSDGQHGGQGRQDGQHTQRREQPPLPSLDVTHLTVVNARDGRLERHEPERRGQGGGGGTSGISRHPNWEAMEATRRVYGRRGEEAVYEAKRNRLRAVGLDPESVRWISRDNESADHSSSRSM